MIKVIPPMSRAEWEALPEIVKRFVSWEEAQQGKVIELPDPQQADEAVQYFTNKNAPSGATSAPLPLYRP